MQHVKQYEITMESGKRRIVDDNDINKGHLYYTEIGPGFGMECVTAIRLLPNERILDEIGNAHRNLSNLITGRDR